MINRSPGSVFKAEPLHPAVPDGLGGAAPGPPPAPAPPAPPAQLDLGHVVVGEQSLFPTEAARPPARSI